LDVSGASSGRAALKNAMAGALYELLSRDHERLDALLTHCLETEDAASYDTFRRGLLRHIAIEERVLFPALRKRSGRTELEAQLHREHAALAALLVVPPTLAELERIASILQLHNELEEREGGLYELIEGVVEGELDELMEQVRRVPEVRVVPTADSAIARSSIGQLLREVEEGRRRSGW
jgi:hemerythrin-like domain-containing protein